MTSKQQPLMISEHELMAFLESRFEYFLQELTGWLDRVSFIDYCTKNEVFH